MWQIKFFEAVTYLEGKLESSSYHRFKKGLYYLLINGNS